MLQWAKWRLLLKHILSLIRGKIDLNKKRITLVQLNNRITVYGDYSGPPRSPSDFSIRSK